MTLAVTLAVADVAAADAVGNPGMSRNRRRVLKLRATIAPVLERFRFRQVTSYRGS